MVPPALADMPAWLVSAADGHVVGAALQRLLPDHAVRSCRPGSVRAKRGRWTVGYELTVTAGSGAERDVVLAGTLRPPGAPLDAPPPSAPFGEPGWAAVLPELGLSLTTAAGDAELPAMPLLTDPAEAARLIGRPVLAAEVVRFKPGSRCTVAYRVDGAPGVVVAKVYRGDEGERTCRAMRALWQWASAARPTVLLAEPLAYAAEHRVLLQAGLPGERTLAAMLAEPDAAAEAVRRAAAGLAELHGSGVSEGQQRGWDDEVGVARERLGRLGVAVPELPAAVEPVLDELGRHAAATPATDPVPSHGAFRPAQVLVAPDLRVGFIDFDSFCLAEPELDVGRFCARLRELGADGLAETFVSTYADLSRLSRNRVTLWERLDLIGNVVQCWTRVQPARLPALASALDRLG